MRGVAAGRGVSRGVARARPDDSERRGPGKLQESAEADVRREGCRGRVGPARRSVARRSAGTAPMGSTEAPWSVVRVPAHIASHMTVALMGGEHPISRQ